MSEFINILTKLEPLHQIGFKNSFINDNNRWEILDHLYTKYVINNTIEKGNIPKKIHQIWLGGTLPSSYSELIKSWKIHNPDWEHKIWGDNDLKEFGLDNDEEFKKIKNIGSKSDIFRYHILKKYGGLYADTDFLCVKNLDWITNFDFVGGGFSIIFDRNNSPEIYNGLFATSPNHPIVNICIKEVYNSLKLSTDVLNQTGPRFFTESIFKNLNRESNGVVLPMNYFYPFPAVKRFNRNNIPQWIKPETLCVHLWYSSWQ
jgi:mannosyltransferase OCH1-like enzyme